ncbi:MAG TPA: hypothetical protein VEN79_03430, partial [Terriglobia bacterium]|nr:hypothetical protein [Terriglobia bacterium]
MRSQRYSSRHNHVQVNRSFTLWGWALALCLLMFLASAPAQEEPPEPPPAETRATQTLPDTLLPQITAAIQGVTTPDVNALQKALHIGERPEGPGPGAPRNTVAPVGDLDGDGVPEMLLRWAIPDAFVGTEVTPAPDSRPLWGVYLLSWTGTQWKASRLLTGIEDFTPHVINLGPPVGRGLALVILDGDSRIPYPVVFQVKDHSAALLWDAQADESRYQPLLQGRLSFTDNAGAPAEMVATGRADPGFLQVDRRGQRGFQARVVYHWTGTAFIPAKTEYSSNPDY